MTEFDEISESKPLANYSEALAAAALLAACGGGGSGSSSAGGGGTTTPVTPQPELMPTQAQASRLLAQASFGPTTASIDQVAAIGYTAWINDQFSKPQTLHRPYMDTIYAALPAGSKPSQNNFFETFWQQAITGDDQLRQRIKFALSQIFVISMVDSTVGDNNRAVAAFYDVLGKHAFGNYRDLLQEVTLHPMMGVYLTMLHNQKESGNLIPDQNYAREVMQLFTIGLYQLNMDGTNKLNNGQPIETYGDADIVGLSRVFTGWSWAGPDQSDTRFFGGNRDANADWQPMQQYSKYHSVSEKKFLGVTIAPQQTADGVGDLKLALDALFNHANLPPFFAQQMIQRLVTSNPSPQYVARVANVFVNNGAGVRGDMKAVIKAILLDTEARAAVDSANPNLGKVREPVVRLANWMRAFNAKSTSANFLLSNLDDPLTALGQSPMRSPSVFNFFRPGYVPPNTSIANANLVSPEMQITGETSVVGYLNVMRDVIPNGIGTGRDVQADYTAELALATTPDKLVDRINLLLMYNDMSSALKAQIIAAVGSITIPTSTQTSIDAAKKNRVSLAIFLTMASPEYLVQK